jgi:hypothetical protein
MTDTKASPVLSDDELVLLETFGLSGPDARVIIYGRAVIAAYEAKLREQQPSAWYDAATAQRLALTPKE